MKKHKIKKLFGLLLVAVTAALSLAGCHIGGHVIGMSDYYYDDAEKYTAGEAEFSSVVNIEISWMVGSVKILPHDSDTVSVSETSERELTENMRLHCWLDRTTLRIKLCASGKYDLSKLEKELTVLVPKTLTIGNLKVNALSADVTVSGCAVTQLFEVDTISGSLNAELIKPLNEFDGDSTSGSITVRAPSVSEFNVETVSGAISLFVQKEPERLEIDDTSGNINLTLPESASFTLDYDSTSGDISSNIAFKKSFGKYIFGDGTGEYNIDTVSGNLQINKGE